MSEQTPDPPEGAVAIAVAPNGRWAYRGKRGCEDMWCTRDGNSDRCYGWHCGLCDGRSNCQASCRCEPAPLPPEEAS